MSNEEQRRGNDGDAGSQTMRVLPFPTEHSVGFLVRLVDPETHATIRLGAAQGPIAVPHDSRIILYWEKLVADLSPLDRLEPDDLYGLGFDAEWRGTDSEYVHLAGLSGLRTLDLHHAGWLTDRGLSSLAPLVALEELVLWSFGINDRNIVHLPPFPALRRLNLTENATMGDAALPFLQRYPLLEFLSLGTTNITDAGLATLAQIQTLRSLELDTEGITGSGLVHLWALPLLRDLFLFHDALTDAGIMNLRGLPRLERLTLGGDGFTDEGLRVLAALPALRYLSLRGNGVTDAGLHVLGSLHELRELDLLGERMGYGVLPVIGTLVHLHTLVLPATHIPTAELVHLRNLHALRRLDIGQSGAPSITDDGLVPVGQITSLEDLNLVAVALTDAGLPHLYGLHRLRRLHLSWALHLTAAGVRALEQALPDCKITVSPRRA